jgi:transposase
MRLKTKPKVKQGLTTEEVSKVLDVSITTVIRYFDEGILTGWKNPINGRVVIDPKSVNALVAFTQKRAVTLRKAVDDFVRRGHKKG